MLLYHGADGTPIAIGSSPTTTLHHVCLELQAKVDAFLAEDVDTKLLRGLQAQVREAMGVINEALERYR